MRVLQVTTSTQRRGAEVFAHQLALELAERSHEVRTVALSAHSGDRALPFEVLTHQRFDPRTIRAIAGEAARHQVVVAHGGASLAPVAVAARLSGRPFVYRNIGDPSHWGSVRGADARIGAPLRRAAAVVALYEGARRFMVQQYRLDPARVVVASNAVDARQFRPVDEGRRMEARARLGVAPDAPTVGYLGALSPEKRPDWCLAIAEHLPQVTVLVAGEGPLEEDLRMRAQHARWGGRLKLVGATDDPSAFLAALDALVLPSRTEGVPGVLLEAALTGVPVVATAVGGVAEVVEAARAGVVVDPGDRAMFVRAVDDLVARRSTTSIDREGVLARHSLPRITDVWERVLAGASGETS